MRTFRSSQSRHFRSMRLFCVVADSSVSSGVNHSGRQWRRLQQCLVQNQFSQYCCIKRQNKECQRSDQKHSSALWCPLFPSPLYLYRQITERQDWVYRSKQPYTLSFCMYNDAAKRKCRDPTDRMPVDSTCTRYQDPSHEKPVSLPPLPFQRSS